jgi:hypothetical protein
LGAAGFVRPGTRNRAAAAQQRAGFSRHEIPTKASLRSFNLSQTESHLLTEILSPRWRSRGMIAGSSHHFVLSVSH